MFAISLCQVTYFCFTKLHTKILVYIAIHSYTMYIVSVSTYVYRQLSVTFCNAFVSSVQTKLVGINLTWSMSSCLWRLFGDQIVLAYGSYHMHGIHSYSKVYINFIKVEPCTYVHVVIQWTQWTQWTQWVQWTAFNLQWSVHVFRSL